MLTSGIMGSPSLFGRYVVALLVLLCLLPYQAAAQEKGSPLVRHFTPDDYQSQTQVFDIIQAADHTLLFSTGRGIIQYDGARFRPIEGRARMVTVLHRASSDSILFGGNNFIGTLAETPSNGFSYISRSSSWNNTAFGAAFNMTEFNGSTYFAVRETFMRYHGGQFDTIPSAGQLFFRTYQVDDHLFVVEQRQGLLWLNERDSLELAPGGEQFSGGMIPYFMLPFDDERLLFGTAQRGLFLYYPESTSQTPAGTILPFPNDVNDELAAAISVEGIRLLSGNIAIGTGNAGVFIISPEGQLVQRINSEAGFPTDFVNALFEDRQGNLWIGQNNGLILAEIASPLSFYGERNGLTGLPLDMQEVNQRLYVGASTGLFHLEGGRFEPVDAIRALTWELAPHLDTSGRPSGSVFAANQFGLYLKEPSGVTALHEGGTSSVLQSTRQPGVLYVGTQNGLLRFIRTPNGFEEDLALPVEDPVRYLIEDPAEGLWVLTQAAGIFFVPDSFQADEVRHYRTGNDGSVLSNAYLQIIRDTLYLTNNEWMYRYQSDSGGFERFTPPGLTENDLHGAFHFVYHDGTMWMGSSVIRDYISEIRGFFGPEPEIITHPFASIPSGTITLRAARGLGDIWFGTTGGLYRYRPGHLSDLPVFNDVRLQRMEVISDTTLSFYPSSGEQVRLPFSTSRKRFSFASPWFNAQEMMEFRHRLRGLDEQWSAWSTQTFTEYTSLREGRYTMDVQARNREGLISDPVQWSFVISPPWYRTIWAYGMYAGLLVLVIFGGSRTIARRRLEKLETFNEELERQVDERAEEIRRQNEQLRLMNQEKADFMNIAAHDLRNPLTAVQGIASIMADPDEELDKQDILDFADIISRSSDRMFELIENYLNVHKLEQGDVQVEVKPLNLAEEIMQSVERFAMQTAKKKMTVRLLGAEEEVPVLADPTFTGQVLDNVLSNAIKYAPIGSEITVQLHRNEKEGGVTITDEGPGIPEDKMNELYKKFCKIGSIPTGGEVSTGLGLSIVKQLLNMMGGDIRCESRPGEGASFTVVLPVRTPAVM